MQLTSMQLDAIKEIVNMGSGRAASILNQMFTSRVILQIPEIQFIEASKIHKELYDNSDELISVVNLDFEGNFLGTSKLIFPTESASKLVRIFAEEETDEDEFNEIRSSTLAEIGNIVLNSLMGAISNFLELRLDYSIPLYQEFKLSSIFSDKGEDIDKQLFFAHTKFSIDEFSIAGDFILVFEIGSLDAFLALIDDYINEIEDD
jgi:chemotaxis protein CheC